MKTPKFALAMLIGAWTILSVYYFQVTELVKVPMKPEDILYKYTDKEDYLINTSGCYIPNYGKTIKFYEAEKSKKNCGHRVVFVTVMNQTSLVVKINFKQMKQYYKSKPLKCWYKFASRSRKAGKRDTTLEYTNSVQFPVRSETTIPFKTEYLKVICDLQKNLQYEDNYAFVKQKETIANVSEGQNSKHYNVLIVGMDTMSRARSLHTMPQTVKYLQDNGWIDYKGYQKVEYNTFPNFMAILTGKTMSTVYKTCKGMQACKHLLIWNRYKDAGYVTAYGEDNLDLPDTFAPYKGFDSPPTDHYMRPFFLQGENLIGNTVCCGKVASGVHVLNYALDFVNTYKDRKFFGWFWINSFSHNLSNLPSLYDSETLKFFQSINKTGILKNTFVIFLSDHGMRFGKTRFSMESYYEERLPMLFIWAPFQFQEQQAISQSYHSLIENQYRLTTPYDLHMTLQNILKLSNNSVKIERSEACPQCHSLWREKPLNRTCDDAAVDAKWCTCHNLYEPTDELELKLSINTAASTVQYLAKSVKTKPGTKCATLKLKKVLRNHVYQSGDFNYYVIAFTMTPGDLTYEATVRTDGNEFKTINPTHTIDSFHNNGNCAINKYDKAYCICEKS